MRSPRSVAEILPGSFESMTVADVRGMLDGMGDERETLFVELKSTVTSEGLSKSCAAFANTYGGILVGGADNKGKLVGMAAPGGEVAMWVKNILRTTVLPLPPFRARWLPLTKKTGATGLLLVLVEESSTTPHLLLLVLVEESSTTPHLLLSRGRSMCGLRARATPFRSATKPCSLS